MRSHVRVIKNVCSSNLGKIIDSIKPVITKAPVKKKMNSTNSVDMEILRSNIIQQFEQEVKC